jgi:hypothetical protein
MASIWDDLGSTTPNPEAGSKKGPAPEQSGSIWDIPAPDAVSATPQKRGILGAANDYAIELANAALGLPKAAIDLVSPGSELSASIGRLQAEGEFKQSDVAKAAKAKLSQSMQSEDLTEQAKGAAQYVLQNPGLAASQALGSFVGPGAAITGGRILGGALNLSERAAGRVALGSGAATTGVLAGGDAAGDAYQTVINSPSLVNLPIEERERLATDAARKASAVPFAIGAATTLLPGAEKALATGTKSILKTGLTEFASEAFEEGSTKLSANIAAKQYAPETQISSGVVGSAVLGGMLGGGTGLAVGAMTKQPDSLLPGSTNISAGEPSPDGNAINKAIDANSSEIATDTPLQLDAIKQQQAELDQIRTEAKQEADAIAQQQAVEQAQAQSEAAQQEFNYKSAVYGIKPLDVANQYRIGNKQFFTTAQAQQFIQGMEDLNQGLGDELKFMIGAAVNSGALKIDQKATPKSVNNAAVKFLSDYGLADATGVDDAVGRVEAIINTLEGPKALKEADQLNSFYKSITGTDSPAFVSLQQLAAETTPKKGASNEQLQLQTNAGLRAVPEQSGATQASGEKPGDVRPTSVQPIQSGSVGAGSLGLQTGAIPSGGIPTSTSTGGSRVTVPDQSSNQEAQVSSEREDALKVINQVITRAFGERDAKIVLAVLSKDQTQAQIAKEFGISDARVNQIAGPQAQETWGPRILLAARNMGISKEEMGNFLELMSKEETVAEEQVVNEELLTEAPTEETSGLNVDDTNVATSDEDMRLGTEEVSTGEEGGPSGFRVFNPDVSGATELEDASAQNRTRRKLKTKEISQLKDFELNNLAADENTTVEELDEIVAELLRRQEVRVAKGEPSAVQKPSTEKKAVRNKPAASEGVRKQDTERVEVARARQEGETDEEAAAKAWDEGIKDFPEAPKFADLSEEQQADWISFGEENWTPADVQTELVKLAKEPKLYSKSAQTFFFDEIEEQPGFDRIRNYLDITGIPNALDFVSDWATINDPKAEPGSIESLGGRYKITVNVGVGSEAYIGETARHEIGHAVDMAPHGGVYSAQPEMSVVLKNGVLTPVGKVAKELYSLYQNSSRWNEFLAYPFDVQKFTDLDTAVKVELEMFAQAFTVYTDPNAKRLLEREAPITAAYFAEVINDIKSTKALQIQKATTTAERVVRFKNRNAPERPQAAISIVQRRAEEAGPKQLSLSKARQQADKQLDKLPKEVQKPVRYVTDTIENFAKNAVPYAAFTEDLADIASKFIPSVKKYVNLMKERQAIRTRLERQVDDILQAYDKLPNEVKGTGENSVNKFLMDSTRDGKWAYNPGWIKNFDETKDIDPDMKDRFDSMPAPAQDIIKRVFAHGQSTLLAMQKSVVDNINTEYDALIDAAKKAGKVEEEQDLIKKKAASLTDYRTLMRINSKKPYAPLKRFGDFVVVGKSQQYIDTEKVVNDPNSAPDVKAEAAKKLRELEKNDLHYFVQFAETVGEAKAIARTEAANYAQVEDFEKDTSNNYGGRDIQSTFHRLRNLVEDTKDSNLSDASERAVNRLLADLHLTLLSEQSARQSERRRRGIGGAEKDMMRAFATQGRATASFISSLENTGNIYDILREMKKETDSSDSPGTRAERRQYYNEFMKRHFMGMEYRPSPFMDKALSTTSAWMLLTNPAYYLQNMTQPFMMSLPVIGGKHGYARSWKEMTRAYNDIASVIKKHGLSENSYNKLPEDVRNVVEVLVNRGRIDISLEQDLGRWRSTEDAKLAKFGRATELLRGMAQDIETINRVATAVAAYRLEVKNSNPTRATDYADKIIYTTHGDYSAFNAPRITRQGLGRLATQFRKFQLIQISLIARLYNDAFNGEDAATRLIGKKALAYTIGHTAVMGGLMGLPGFAAIAALYGMLFGDEDEPDNPELALRRAIGDDSLADLLVKGVPAALGVDVSGKLGMGQMLSILPYTDVKFTRKDLPAAGYALLTGPFGGLTLKAADGINYIGSGDYQKGLEQLLPSGLGNILKAERYATEGITTRAGDVVMKPEDIGAVDAFMVALGLPTKPIIDRNFLNAAKFQYDEFYNEKASDIKREYVRAYKEGDNAGLSEAREEWKNLQESRAKNGYTKQPLSNLLKAPQEQKKRERNVTGGVQYNKANRGFVKKTSEL